MNPTNKMFSIQTSPFGCFCGCLLLKLLNVARRPNTIHWPFHYAYAEMLSTIRTQPDDFVVVRCIFAEIDKTYQQIVVHLNSPFVLDCFTGSFGRMNSLCYNDTTFIELFQDKKYAKLRYILLKYAIFRSALIFVISST